MRTTQEYEGLRLRVYRCTAGHRTIGYGHNLDAGNNDNVVKIGLDPELLKVGQAITVAQAEQLFFLDYSDAAIAVRRLVPELDDLHTIARRVLIDLCFNMGYVTLSKFKNTLAAFRRADYAAAADGLEKSLWYKQVKTRGREIVAALREIA